MRRTVLWGLMVALTLGVLQPAVAKKGNGKGGGKGGMVGVIGMVTGVNVDADPSTADGLTVEVIKGNGPARRYLAGNPGDPTVLVNGGTRFQGESGMGRSLADYRVGDGVQVQAKRSGDDLVARRVRLVLQAFEGTLASFDGTTAEVAWMEANKVAAAWLSANGDPAVVSAAVTPDTKVEREGGDPQPGDVAELKARPSAGGSGLEAVKLQAAPAV